jgi:hypothetical protein
MVNELWEVAERGLALLILIAFFVIIYVKIRGQTVSESWDDIKNWIGASKK